MASYTSGRHKFTRGPVTNRVKAKLVKMMKASEGIETLVAEDIVEAMAIGRNDTEGFRAVDKFLDELTEKYEAIANS